MKDIVLPLLAGVGCGVLSAWGVGGGTLLLLVMTLFFGVDQAAAQGVNLLYFLPTAAMGLIWHRQNGLLDKALLRRTVPWPPIRQSPPLCRHSNRTTIFLF